MIDSKATVSFAQYNEDIILAALLHDVSKGFYVDVGANYPVIDSVTKRFYEDGWTGINIEPIASLHQQLITDRPKDTNLQCGVGSNSGMGTFREYTKIPGHSTFATEQKKEKGEKAQHKDYQVPIKTLAEIFSKHNVGSIDFLKIDIEGFEYEAIVGNDWKKYRPSVICIESNHIATDWRPILRDNKYKMFIVDGLNEYYIAKEKWSITEGFAERAVKVAYHSLKQHQWQAWAADSKELGRLVKLAQRQDEALKAAHARIHELEDLSLKDRGFRDRLTRALHGLTVDYYHFKKK